MPTLLSGTAARDALIPGLIDKIKALPRAPKLAIIQVGSRPDSNAYISSKKSFGAKIGVTVEHVALEEAISQKNLIGAIRVCNKDASIDGVIVQLPLPHTIDREAVIEAIDPAKDVDGLTSAQGKKFAAGASDAVTPATARGVKELLSFYKLGMAGKNVVIVGRSKLVGGPIAVIAKNEGAHVTICHSQTPDLAAETKKADILIVAVGKPGLITTDHVKEGSVVVDIGTTRATGDALAGDVDHEAVNDIVSAITPVPGGVGPMTVFGLFENLIDLFKV